MGRLQRAELDREWSVSRETLGEILGSPPRTASVPGGFLSADVIAAAAAAGYGLLFTSEPSARVAHEQIEVRGRYTIWATTPARIAAAYAEDDRCVRALVAGVERQEARQARQPGGLPAASRVRARGA